MNYSYESNSYQSCINCSCHEQIQLLQDKLTEVHSKLLQQIDLCRRQESAILDLQLRAQETGKGNSRVRGIYDTFGHSREKQNERGNRNDESSREGYHIKNELLQADLEAMRHRVLTEITEKNKLLEEMGDLKKRFRRQMANEVKKFEGLQIIYRKMLDDRGVGVGDSSGKARTEVERVGKLLQECEGKYLKEREKCRAAEAENRALTEKIHALQDELRRLQREPRERPRAGLEQSSQLREMDNLKQQISQINRNITLRQLQFNERSQQRRKQRSPSSPEDMARRETMLVGESRWGKRPL